MKLRYVDYQNTALFLEAVAEKCVSELKEEDKKILLQENDSLTYHFGIGTYIRNNFIYPQKEFESDDNYAEIFDLIAYADKHSNTVVKLMIELLKK